MIHILDDYYASVDSYCYTLIKDTKTKDKNNKPIYITIGYYSDIKDCIEGLRKYLHKKIATEQMIEIKDYLQQCRQINDTLQQTLETINVARRA